MRNALTIAAVTAFAIISLAQPTMAAPCRDAKGKFIKCAPAPKVATKCRDTKTKKFAKCGLPRTEPLP